MVSITNNRARHMNKVLNTAPNKTAVGISASNNPATKTLLEVLAPFLKDSVMAVEGISVPGQQFDIYADVLLVSEYETVAIILSETDSRQFRDWDPKYPMGLVTDILAVPASSLFFHLDDFAYLLSIANPSLFVRSAVNELKARASKEVRAAMASELSERISVIYPAVVRYNLDVSRRTAVHALSPMASEMILAA